MLALKIYLIFLTVMFLVYACALYRNRKVFLEKTRVLDEVYRLNVIDIECGVDHQWRRQAFEEITYEQMFWKFWIPVKDFYRDHRCLKG